MESTVYVKSNSTFSAIDPNLSYIYLWRYLCILREALRDLFLSSHWLSMIKSRAWYTVYLQSEIQSSVSRDSTRRVGITIDGSLRGNPISVSHTQVLKWIGLISGHLLRVRPSCSIFRADLSLRFLFGFRVGSSLRRSADRVFIGIIIKNWNKKSAKSHLMTDFRKGLH